MESAVKNEKEETRMKRVIALLIIMVATMNVCFGQMKHRFADNAGLLAKAAEFSAYANLPFHEIKTKSAHMRRLRMSIQQAMLNPRTGRATVTHVYEIMRSALTTIAQKAKQERAS